MKKLLLLTFAGFFFILSISFWAITNKGYDRQNEVILFIKKILPSHLARKIRETIFIIPNLQERNKILKIRTRI